MMQPFNSDLNTMILTTPVIAETQRTCYILDGKLQEGDCVVVLDGITYMPQQSLSTVGHQVMDAISANLLKESSKIC